MASAGEILLGYSGLSGTATAEAHFLAIEFGGGDITIINHFKDISMQVSAEQNKIEMQAQVKEKVNFEAVSDEIRIKYDATWRIN